MKNKSLGLIETWGYVPAIEAADAGAKAAAVTLLGYEITKTALVTVKFIGDVAAVKVAVAAGTAAAKKVGKVVSEHVIPRPDPQLSLFQEKHTLVHIKYTSKSTTIVPPKDDRLRDEIPLKTPPPVKKSAQTSGEKVSSRQKSKKTSTPKPSVRSKKVKKVEKPTQDLKKKVGKPKKKKTT